MRCFGNKEGQSVYAKYHDEEWAVPVHDDQKLFEMLILEGCQAGLSWEIILKKRQAYRDAYYDFDPVRVAKMEDIELEKLLENPGIVRNRLKVFAARRNAKSFLQIQKEFGSFNAYIWEFVGNNPILGHYETLSQLPTTSSISDKISKDLKKRNMTFVGSTIIYSFMQAVGLVNDHLKTCPCYLGK